MFLFPRYFREGVGVYRGGVHSGRRWGLPKFYPCLGEKVWENSIDRAGQMEVVRKGGLRVEGEWRRMSEILSEIVGLQPIQTVCIVMLNLAVLFIAWMWYEDTWRM